MAHNTSDDYELELLKMARLLPHYTLVELMALRGLLDNTIGDRIRAHVDTLVCSRVPRDMVVRSRAEQTAQALIRDAMMLIPTDTTEGAEFHSAAIPFLESELGAMAVEVPQRKGGTHG